MLKIATSMKIKIRNKVGKTAQGFAAVVLTVLLSGCALPVPFQIASWALDGISYLATDKTIADHGLSMVAQKDCAIWRGIKGEDICSESDDGEIFAIASNDVPDGQDLDTLDVSPKVETGAADVEVAGIASAPESSITAPAVAPAVARVTEPQSDISERLMIAGKRVWSDSLDADLYFVIGSFSKRDYARRMVDKYQELGPAVMASRLDGAEVYRVAVGPFAADQQRQMRNNLKLVGLNNSWAMRVDHRDWKLASPKELGSPTQSIATVPEQRPFVGDSVKTGAEEIAETPTEPNSQPGLSSELFNNSKHHLVIGSFSKLENANNFVKSNADFSPRVMSAQIVDGWRYRVVVGPYAKAESAQMRRTLAHAGIKNVWALNLNPGIVAEETLQADILDVLYREDQSQGLEIAEVPVDQKQDEVSLRESPSAPSDDEMSWGVNLTEYIFDMFRSSDATDVVGVITPLES